MVQDLGIIPVPGFGFYPTSFWEPFQGLAESQGGNISDSVICEMLAEMWVTGSDPGSGYPQMNGVKSENISISCPPFWDTVTCIPGVGAGRTAVLPCMTEYEGRMFNTSHNITRECLSTGEWATQTNYSACLDNPWPTEDPCLQEPKLCQEDHELYIYLLGYTVSMIALILAIFIFLYFKEMRCLRHKIHTNLFISLLVSNLCWVLIAVIQHVSLSSQSDTLSSIYCSSHIPQRYFHISNFFWMFVEGLYLFLQVQASFSLGSIKLRHCLLLGWGFPLIITGIWTILVYCQEQIIPTPEDDMTDEPGNEIDVLNNSLMVNCPYTTADWKLELLAYNIPVFLLLACNTVFLIWIMAVVISKLRINQGAVSDHFHFRAAKALIVIVPLLGITYLIMIVGPREPDSIFSLLFIYTRSILLSFQGFFISLPYCFLNSEVQGTVKMHWDRWQTTRDVGTVSQSARNSVVTAGFITVCDNISRSRAYTYQTVRNSIIDRRGTDESQRAKGGLLTSSVGPLDGPLVDQNLYSSAQLNSSPLICHHQTTIVDRHNNSSPRANRQQNSSPIVCRHQRQQDSSPLVGRVDWHYNNSSLTSELIQNSSSNPHVTNSSLMVGRHLNQSSTVINGNGNQIEEETRFSN